MKPLQNLRLQSLSEEEWVKVIILSCDSPDKDYYLCEITY